MGLDVNALLRDGWTPQPFRQFIVKLNSRCNLSCSYCYVYEMADTSWKSKPRIISARTLDRVASRIAEHAVSHQLTDIEVILHGGEPLLCGAQFIDDAVRLLRAALPSSTKLSLRLQTNGTLLTTTILDILLKHDIKVGVSFDGTADSHDAHRVHANRRGSHHEVSSALRLLGMQPYAHVFSGILCTVDVKSDPLETYEALVAFAPPRIDFLLPHANWQRLPVPGYGEWLNAVFDRWYDRTETKVRLFEEIIILLLGGHSSTEMVGLSPVVLVVIDTDGAIEQVDTLKSAFEGAPTTDMSIFANSFDDALILPPIVARQIGTKALADRCLACPVLRGCGGGYYPHRYRPGHGFRHPSVYCNDLQNLISHIGTRIGTDVLKQRKC